jgi:uncharacterized protein
MKADGGHRARDVLGFIAFSHGWTWGWWALAALLAAAAGGSVWQMPAVAAFYLGGAGVVIGGVFMTWRVDGRDGLHDLWVRCIDPARIPLGWWLLVLLLYPLLTSVAAVLAGALGLDATLDTANVQRQAADPRAFLVFLGFILLIGPLPEEIGWRGFLLERLLGWRSALAASLLVALAWWSWHLPLQVLPGYFDAFEGGARSPWRQLVSLLPTAVIYTWIYVNTRRSVLAVIVFHFLGNLTGQLLLPGDDVRSVRLWLEIGFTLGVLAHWGPATLMRAPREELAGTR